MLSRNTKYIGCFRSGGLALLLASSVSAGVLLSATMVSQSAYAEGIDLDQGVGSSGMSSIPSSSSAGVMQNNDIYLNAEVNGNMRKDMFAFQQNDAREFLITEKELKAIGILVDKSKVDDKGYVNLSHLTNIQSSYDASKNAIIFKTSDNKALVPYNLSYNGRSGLSTDDELEGTPRSDLAAVINYSVYASSESDKKIQNAFNFNGISTNLDARISGKFGTISSNQLLTYNGGSDSEYDSVRLDSYWSYSDPKKLMTYRVGDVVTRSLSWTSSVHLGGVQVRRNFGIRPNLVTTPMLNYSGSAAVPSAVDLYVNNAKRMSSKVPAGPFDLTDLPTISSSGEAKIVVRDAQGRETVQTLSLYGASNTLKKGLWDFSFEAGTPRRNFGSKSNDYDGKLYALGTSRYGLTNKTTLENHAEIGDKFINAGAGLVTSLWDIGSLSVSGSGSSYKGNSGYKYSASFSAQRWGYSLSLTHQGASKNYNDISSVSANYNHKENDYVDPDQQDEWDAYSSSSTQKSLNQISLSFPTILETGFSVNYTDTQSWDNERSRYAGFNISRSFGKVYGYVNGFYDLEDDNSYSISAGVNVSFGKDNEYTASVDGTTGNDNSNGIDYSISRQMGSSVGDYGWTMHGSSGDYNNYGVSGRYRSSFAEFAGSVERSDHLYRATADVNGALVFADKSVIPANQIYDSFAVVNAGAPGVRITSNNGYYGTTGWNGRLVLPNLVSYTNNNVGVEIESLPPDALVTETDSTIMPSYQSGVVQHFGVAEKADYIYAALQDPQGQAVPTGSYAVVDGSGNGVDIGYDGIGVVPTKNSSYPLNLTVYLPDNKACRAVIGKDDANQGIAGGAIPIVCTPIDGKVALPKN